MRSRSNGGVIGAYALPTQNYANGVFFIHDAAIYNTGPNPIWPLGTGFIYSASGGTVATAAFNSNYKTHTFTSNSSFTVATGSGFLDILLVGGGGSGGTHQNTAGASGTYFGAAGGGGGGGIMVIRTFVNPGTTFTVEVGQGGQLANNVTYRGADGKPSAISSNMGHNYRILGGGVGAGYVGPTYGGLIGGNGGGGGGGAIKGTNHTLSDPGITTLTGTSTTDGAVGGGSYTTYGGNGGTTLATTIHIGGGGGGASGPGYGGNYTVDTDKAGWGANGWQWPVTQLYYGAGGGAGRVYTATYSPLTTAQKQTARPGLTATGVYATGAGAYVNADVNSIGVAGESAVNGYGSGGGGGATAGSTGASIAGLGGAGGHGTVIFCYRYQ